ncbi:metallophosphoesterase [Pseudomonas sp. R5(2019)]|uniref:metallophosphoesterase n=1 Tax=Pseudomonas sp. R5(2019) TaxID=2697566 RepID=UPI001411FC99|nr:metallophosphoesterase [Pseudomonas sp. R5(2019)]NBA96283.1 serine/threonine protein phosphatase [Pseudomonas sp. R5(2019)]
MSSYRHFSVNPTAHGRDWAVGDIHGYFDRLQRTLDSAGFDPTVDRLFSVGDLVDRGPQSLDALDWLERPWFFAVQGNHEALAIAHVQGGWLDHEMYRASGGGWFLDLPAQAQRIFARRFAQMPLVMEVETALGTVGFVHADCPFAQWQRLREEVIDGHLSSADQESCQWSRRRLQLMNESPVSGLRALIVGHTPLREVTVLGNVYHIDTAGWATGHFTLLDLATLTAVA